MAENMPHPSELTPDTIWKETSRLMKNFGVNIRVYALYYSNCNHLSKNPTCSHISPFFFILSALFPVPKEWITKISAYCGE